MSINPALLAILACPQDKGPLYYIESESILFNPRLARSYRITDGIPVMLVEESIAVDATEVTRLLAHIDQQNIAPTFAN